MELQSIRFDAEKFSAAQAKAWLKDHSYEPILFEPASGDKAEAAGEFVLLEAASDSGESYPTVRGVAYSGGKMTLPGWRHPVVVDLAGLEIPPEVPLLTNHENRTGSRVGLVRARVEGDTLVIDGEILSSSGQARGIVEQARAGADWQLSIGAEVGEAELVRDRREVNGLARVWPHPLRQFHSRSGYVLVLGQLPRDSQVDESELKLSTPLEKVVARSRPPGVEAVFRPHPRAREKNASYLPRCKAETLAEAIEGARFAVMINSNSGNECLALGCPVQHQAT